MWAVTAFDSPIESMPSILRLSLLVLMSGAGPFLLFAEGLQTWAWVASTLTMTAILAAVGVRARRVSPETEWFAFWWLCAAVAWVLIPWLLLAASAI